MPWSKVQPDYDEPRFIDLADKGGRTITYAEAIREALSQALLMDPSVFLMGQGVDDPSGMFGTTIGLKERFGEDRVFDTPLAENALTGIAIGTAIGGMRPVYFHNRPDFLLLAMDQIVNHAAKWHYMFGGQVNVPLVLWACIGRGWGSAAQHSQALQGLFAHIPGLKLIMPSSGYDAKGLLLGAIADNNPVIILEHRYNFRHKCPVPEQVYRLPIGKGVIRRKGNDLTIVAISNMVTEAFHAAEKLADQGIEAEIIDPRTIRPLDQELIIESVNRTGRVVIADTGWKTGGVAAEIAAIIAEKAFSSLRGPIVRVCAPDLPTPAGYTLENAFYHGSDEIIEAVLGMLKKVSPS